MNEITKILFANTRAAWTGRILTAVIIVVIIIITSH